MRGFAKLTLALIAAVALLVASVSAQKGKPTPPPAAPTWSVEMSGPSIYSEGLVTSAAVVLDVKVWGTPRKNIVQPCNNCTVFSVEVKTPWSVGSSGPYIEFNGVELAAEYNYNNVEPNCRFPSFGADGVIKPDVPATATVGCAPAFLSHRHPQSPYNRVLLEVKVAGDALAMQDGTSLTSKGIVTTQVTGPDCYTTPPADQVHFITLNNPNAPAPESPNEYVTVRRSSPNQWSVEVFRATGVIDVPFSGPDPKFGSCSYRYAFWSYTKPLTTTMLWTRQ